MFFTSFQKSTVEQYAMRAFASSLDVIPMQLADNSGLNAIDQLTFLKSMHLKGKNLGVDCLGLGNDM